MIQAPYEVSKFLTIQMLLTPSEVEAFFTALGDFELFDNSRVLQNKTPVTREYFLNEYQNYFYSLKDKSHKTLGAYAMTCDPDAIFALNVGEKKVLIKPKEPIIQMKEHLFIVGEEGDFHSGVHGENVFRWGFEMSFPQIFVDPDTRDVHQVMREQRFLNAELFRKGMKWMRHNTRPAPFIIGGVLRRASFRLGLDCFDYASEVADMQKFSLSIRRRHR